MSRFVTVVNRTNEHLTGTWNGRHYDILPGKNQFTEQEALAFKRQNPVMGSSDPRVATEYDLISGKSIYKLGIEENGDDCSPLTKINEGVERFDRSQLIGAKPSEIVPGDNGLYSVRGLESPRFNTNDTGFVKP